MTRAEGVEEGPTEFLFDVELMARMDEAGLFARASRIELRGGRLIEMAPIGGDHGDIDGNVHRLLWRLIDSLGAGDLRVVSATLEVASREAPIPDAMVVRGRGVAPYYKASHALLVVEVAQSSLADDLQGKRDAYAAGAVPEYWVIDGRAREVHVFTDPRHGVFHSSRLLRATDRVSPLFADGRGDIAVAELF